AGPEDRPDDDREGDRAWREQGGDDDEQETRRKGVERGGEPGDEIVDPAAEVAGHKAQQHADGELDEGRDEANEEGDLTTVEEPDHLAAAYFIASEQIGERVERRSAVGVEQVLPLERRLEDVLREQWRSHREQDDEHHDRTGR